MLLFKHCPLPALALLALCACDSTSNDDQTESPIQGDGGDGDGDGDGERAPGIHVGEREVIFQTDTFELEPGQERYLCYATTTEEELVIDGYESAGAPFLHHVVFSRANAPEPEGWSECDILFRYTWEPLFLTGAGASELDFPEGNGHKIPAGTQLVVQLHLLNATEDPIAESVAITMKRSSAEDPKPIGTYAFGSSDVSLPPSQSSMLEAVCTVDEPVHLVAMFPHMHLLGTAMTFEVGKSEDDMEMVFERDPYNFDDQHVELIDLTLEPGDVTRVRCSYDNPHDETITFGESTKNEMCFLIGFAANREGLSGCTVGGGDEPGEEVPVDPAAGACGEHEPTSTGIGLACTSDGMECAAGQMCTATFSGKESGLCISLGCETDADCGDGDATCCTTPQGGGSLKICTPEACRSPSCIPTAD
jgi:hypothetical protein